MKKLLALLLAVLMVVALFAGCAPKAEDPAVDEPAVDEPKDEPKDEEPAAVDAIKIGVVVPLSGASAYYGEAQLGGIERYAKYVNDNGGIASLGGAKIELVVADTASDPATGSTEAERLITQEKVVAITGGYNSGVASTVSAICARYQIPYMATNAISVPVLEGMEYSWRANQSALTDTEATITVTNDVNAIAPGSISKTAFVYENNEFGNTQMQAIKDAGFEERTGCEITLEEVYDPGITDFSTILNKIRAAGCDTVYVNPAFTDAVLFTNQYHEYGMTDINFISLGNGMVNAQYFEEVGDKAENFLILPAWSIDIMYSKDQEIYDFAMELCEEYAAENDGLYPDATWCNGWLGMGCLAAVLEKAGSVDSAAIQTAFDEIEIDYNDIATCFHAYGVDFDTVETMHGQNVYALSVFCQVIDGELRAISPSNVLKDNPLIWPQFGE